MSLIMYNDNVAECLVIEEWRRKTVVERAERRGKGSEKEGGRKEKKERGLRREGKRNESVSLSLSQYGESLC